MHFASQAHRDKLNFKIKTLSIHYPLLVTMRELFKGAPRQTTA